jgi:hypothetical protein
MSVSRPDSRGASSARRGSVAEKVARDIVGCDASILSLMVLDEANGSHVLAVARSQVLPPEEYADADLVKRFAIAAMVVWGAAEQAARLMGGREFIVGAFENQLVLLVHLREYRMLAAMRLSGSSNAEHVYAKVARLLGLGPAGAA